MHIYSLTKHPDAGWQFAAGHVPFMTNVAADGTVFMGRRARRRFERRGRASDPGRPGHGLHRVAHPDHHRQRRGGDLARVRHPDRGRRAVAGGERHDGRHAVAEPVDRRPARRLEPQLHGRHRRLPAHGRRGLRRPERVPRLSSLRTSGAVLRAQAAGATVDTNVSNAQPCPPPNQANPCPDPTWRYVTAPAGAEIWTLSWFSVTRH